MISKFSKKNGYDNLSNETDYESISINLYRSFIHDIRENKCDALLKYCAKDIIMKIDINTLKRWNDINELGIIGLTEGL